MGVNFPPYCSGAPLPVCPTPSAGGCLWQLPSDLPPFRLRVASLRGATRKLRGSYAEAEGRTPRGCSRWSLRSLRLLGAGFANTPATSALYQRCALPPSSLGARAVATRPLLRPSSLALGRPSASAPLPLRSAPLRSLDLFICIFFATFASVNRYCFTLKSFTYV